MVDIKLKHFYIHPLLQGYIKKLWVFESSGRVPDTDIKLIVPNGLVKLVIPFKNGLSGKMDGWYHLSRENTIALIGISDIPSVVDAENNDATGTIGVEFSPLGVYRFFHFKQSDIKNQIHSLPDVLGKLGKNLEERIGNTVFVEDKIALIQNFLLTLFLKKESDLVFEHAIQIITNTNGKVSVKELSRQSGFSSRWLNTKFIDYLGVSPKNLGSILRFQYYYAKLITNPNSIITSKEFYDDYYDQSHFLKDFKRFTGTSPTGLLNSQNDFGSTFYK